jgi:hypothetical protein
LEDSDQMLTGQVPDISPLLKYKFNEPVYYRDSNQVSQRIHGSAWVLGRNGSQRGTCHDVQDPDGRHKIIVRSCIRTAKKQRTYVSITTRERLQCSSHQQRRRLRKEGALPTFDASDLFGPSSPCQMMRETRENHSDRFIGTGTGRGPQAQPPETPTYTMETQGRRDLR